MAGRRTRAQISRFYLFVSVCHRHERTFALLCFVKSHTMDFAKMKKKRLQNSNKNDKCPLYNQSLARARFKREFKKERFLFILREHFKIVTLIKRQSNKSVYLCLFPSNSRRSENNWWFQMTICVKWEKKKI